MIASRHNRLLFWLSPALVLLVSACHSGAGSPRPTPTPTPRQRLETAVAQLNGLSGFHFLVTHQNGASTIAPGLLMTRAEGDFARPDRFSAKINASFQGLPAAIKVINVGNKTWITNPLQAGDHYQLLPSGVQTAAIFDSNSGVIKATEQMNDPQPAGNERLGNVDTYILKGSVDAGQLQSVATDAQRGLVVPARVWIGRGDSLIYRIRLEGPLSPSEPKNIVRQVDLSQFGEKPDIQPPDSTGAGSPVGPASIAASAR